MKTNLFNPLKAATLLLLLSVLLSVNSVLAQVAINIDNTTADPKAILDVKSTIKGVLIPRMTSTQRNNIISPPQGLMVYVTTDHKFYYFNGTVWTILSANSIDDLSDGRTGLNTVFLGEGSGKHDNMLNSRNTAVGAYSMFENISGNIIQQQESRLLKTTLREIITRQ